ncbi:hypothetical protein GCM10010174_64620 [Kutzneria viridogrisea]|uniref:Uncharacterized protein n=2 Tax=Kutzneria TaxID=43356 RepID=W5WQJ1_9PSEU|nr:hypothetical protein [Kutzneria albida]AHI00450.1 hypothetical protein KALB_7092 [Kutzneria albida DSM 43870]MBA8925629.1 ElaB/YqjD/DUF883 family membrane-anchored ribosome-binding protein [Kutzneria viridogrisea]
MSNAIIAEVDEKLREIERDVQRFFDAVNEVLSWVPDFLSDLIEPIRRGIEGLNQKLREFWDRINQMLTQRGDSDRLKQAGDAWVDQVGNPAGDLAGSLSLDKLRTTVDWSGRAAEAYKASVPAQVSGLGGIKDLANQMKSSLVNLANAIDNFWLAIKAALVVFAVGAVAAIATACTVVGLPAAIAAIATAVGVSVGLVVTAVTSMQSLTQTIAVEQGNLKQKIHDDLGSWARTNTEVLGHASVNDPSGMNWHVTA